MIALVGAGGKMGRRIIPNLIKFGYDFVGCEKDQTGLDALTKLGVKAMATEDAVKTADIVVFALPDAALPKLSEKLVPLLKSGATVITLDPAAAYANKLALRDDCTFIVTHPCHPQLFGERNSPEEKADLFGGTAAVQDIVIALLQGDEKKFDEAEQLCIKMFNPVNQSFRITVEQMAILEPAAAEVVIALCATIMKEAIDEAVKNGVPRPAAESFLLGHIQIPLAIVLKSSNPFSDAAMIAVDYGRRNVLKENWKDVFKREKIQEVLREMLHLDK
ncbi:MAG: phosphogluconate dehydrogenase C-terminal domain-containing protein [Eubacteriales bacterium]